MEEFITKNLLNVIILPIFLWIALWLWLTIILPEFKKLIFSFLLKKRNYILKKFRIDIAKPEAFSYVEWHRNSDAPVIFKVLIMYIIGVSLGILWEIGFEAIEKGKEFIEYGQFVDLINVFIFF